MKTIITFALLLLIPLSSSANEQLTIEAMLFEGRSADIVHDIKKLSQTKGVNVLHAPQITTALGKEGKVAISGKDVRKLQAIQPFCDMLNGVQIRLIPKKENGRITFRGQVVVRELVGDGGEHCEIESRELYISGAQRVGGKTWFEFKEDSEGKKIAVCIVFTEKIAEQDGADQPATVPESKPDVKEKPQPGSQVRSQ